MVVQHTVRHTTYSVQLPQVIPSGGLYEPGDLAVRQREEGRVQGRHDRAEQQQESGSALEGRATRQTAGCAARGALQAVADVGLRGCVYQTKCIVILTRKCKTSKFPF